MADGGNCKCECPCDPKPDATYQVSIPDLGGDTVNRNHAPESLSDSPYVNPEPVSRPTGSAVAPLDTTTAPIGLGTNSGFMETVPGRRVQAQPVLAPDGVALPLGWTSAAAALLQPGSLRRWDPGQRGPRAAGGTPFASGKRAIVHRTRHHDELDRFDGDRWEEDGALFDELNADLGDEHLEQIREHHRRADSAGDRVGAAADAERDPMRSAPPTPGGKGAVGTAMAAIEGRGNSTADSARNRQYEASQQMLRDLDIREINRDTDEYTDYQAVQARGRIGEATQRSLYYGDVTAQRGAEAMTQSTSAFYNQRAASASEAHGAAAAAHGAQAHQSGSFGAAESSGDGSASGGGSSSSGTSQNQQGLTVGSSTDGTTRPASGEASDSGTMQTELTAGSTDSDSSSPSSQRAPSTAGAMQTSLTAGTTADEERRAAAASPATTDGTYTTTSMHDGLTVGQSHTDPRGPSSDVAEAALHVEDVDVNSVAPAASHDSAGSTPTARVPAEVRPQLERRVDEDPVTAPFRRLGGSANAEVLGLDPLAIDAASERAARAQRPESMHGQIFGVLGPASGMSDAIASGQRWSDAPDAAVDLRSFGDLAPQIDDLTAARSTGTGVHETASIVALNEDNSLLARIGGGSLRGSRRGGGASSKFLMDENRPTPTPFQNVRSVSAQLTSALAGMIGAAPDLPESVLDPTAQPLWALHASGLSAKQITDRATKRLAYGSFGKAYTDARDSLRRDFEDQGLSEKRVDSAMKVAMREVRRSMIADLYTAMEKRWEEAGRPPPKPKRKDAEEAIDKLLEEIDEDEGSEVYDPTIDFPPPPPPPELPPDPTFAPFSGGMSDSVTANIEVKDGTRIAAMGGGETGFGEPCPALVRARRTTATGMASRKRRMKTATAEEATTPVRSGSARKTRSISTGRRWSACPVRVKASMTTPPRPHPSRRRSRSGRRRRSRRSRNS